VVMVNRVSDHLSLLSKMGRGGDTKLRNVDGELSHVNADEAAAIDMYGSVGENVVKAVGSGTINPYTGNKEYFIDPLSLGMAGVSIYSSMQGVKEGRDQARDQLKFLDQQAEELIISKDELVKTKEAKTDVAYSEFHQNASLVGESTSEAQRGLDEAAERTGLKTSKSVSGGKRDLWKKFERAETGMYSNLGKAMGEVEGWFEAETGRIDADMKRIEAEKKVQSSLASKKFLGMF